MDLKNKSYRILFGVVVLGSLIYFAFIFLKGYSLKQSPDLGLADNELSEQLPALADSVHAIENSISLENTLSGFEEDIFNYINEELDKLLEQSNETEELQDALMMIGDEAINRITAFKSDHALTAEQGNRLKEIELYVNIQVIRDRERSERLIEAMENDHEKLAVIMSYLQAFAELEDQRVLKKFALVTNKWAILMEGDYAEQVEKLLFKAAPIGEPFPNHFKGQKSIKGLSLDLERFKGKIVLVDFWASWCAPCLQEIPYHKEVYYKYRNQGFDIIYVNLDNTKEAFLETVEEQELPWHHFFEDNGIQGKVAKRYGVERLPASYLIGSDGKVIAVDLKGAELREQLKKLITS